MPDLSDYTPDTPATVAASPSFADYKTDTPQTMTAGSADMGADDPDRQGFLSRTVNQAYGGAIKGIFAHPTATIEAGLSTPDTTKAQIDPFIQNINQIQSSDHSDLVKSLLAGYQVYKAGLSAIQPGEERIAKGFGVENPAPAQTTGDKVADTIGGTAGFLAQMVAAGQMAPEAAAAIHPQLVNAATGTIVGAMGGEQHPGETGAQVGAFEGVNALPLPMALKVPLEAATGYGLSAASGGDTTQNALGALLPAAMHGFHAMAGTPTEPQAAPATEATPQSTGAAEVHPAIQAQQELVNLRGQLERGELEGDAKTQAEQKVDSLAADVQGHIGDNEDLYDQVAGVKEQTPIATENPVATADQTALTNPDRFNQVADTSAPVTQRTGLDDLLAKGKSLLADTSGGAKVPEALSTFADRVVAPAAADVKKSALTSWDNVNRFLGTGVESDEAKRVGQDLRTSWAQQDLDRIRTQQQLAPYRAKAETMTPDQQVNMVDEISHGGKTSDPDMQGFADWHKQRASEWKTRADAAGINTDKWDGGEDWFERMFKFPDSGNGGGSIAGSEGYLKSQKFDTYKEALAAVQAAGGEARYSNPVDTALAKDMEINKSISAREIFNKEIDRGTIEPLKAGESLPPEKGYIDDRLARKMSKAQMWIDPDTGKPAMKPAPRMIADKGIADKLNQIIAPGTGPSVPILKQIAQVKRGATAMNFALSAFHIPMEAVGNASIRIGKAIENLVHGEPVQALKNVGGAFTGSLFEGKALRDQAKNAASNPGLEPIVEASVKAGQKFGVKSALEPSSLERSKTAFKEGDPISGVANRLGSALNAPNRAIMDHFVPTVKAGAMGAWAQDLIRRGLPPEELHKQLSQAGDNIDNVLGQVNRPNQFQHKVMTDLLDTGFPAPKFSEGAIRYGGALARDSVAAIKDMVGGKSPKITPAMYTFGGLLTTIASMGAATQAAYSTATTGKPIPPSSLKDLFYPRTGRKNQDGTDERISLPNPMSFLMSSATEGPMKAIVNRVSPLWRSFMDVVNNSDYRGVKVREGGIGQQIEQSAAHIGKSLLPFSMQSMLEAPAGGEQSLDLKALGFLGVRKAPTSVTHSDAENALNDLTPQHPRTQEEAAKSDTLKSLFGELKSHNPNFGKDVRAAEANKTIKPEDVGKMMRQGGPENFATRIKNSNLAPDDLMQVWGKMTPEEKKATYGSVYRKIAKAPGDQIAKLKQIRDDLKAGQ